ncbi:MAG: ATP-dependent Clp protease ATP-binding subunit, partial [Clostridia bacterium]|nr:ATP-dependent Clp protease ATP-binding subunit [Clostridia bacterium]
MTNPASDSLEKVIKNAGKIALKFGSNQVGTEHILYGLTSVKECMASKILLEYGLSCENLLNIFEENSQTTALAGVDVELTPRSKEIIGMAKQVAMELGHNFVGAEHLLFALLNNANCFAVRLIATYYKVNITELKSKIIIFLQGNNDFTQLQNDNQNKSLLPEKLLDMGYDITLKARQNKIDPIIGREEEIERIIEILCRKTKNNPILIGEAGVGKTAVVEGLA